MMVEGLTGHCLCGAVTITVRGADPSVGACHCAMCRRWSGAVMWGFDAPAAGVEVAGPVKTFRSSSFAERAFCSECGTHLWIRDDGKQYELMPGLFDDAKGFPLVSEVYADRAFACAPFAGDHQRQTAAEYEAAHRHVEDA